MHTAGKVLVWLSLVLSVVAFIFAARVVNARKQWMKEFQDAKLKNEKGAESLATTRLERDKARAEYEREMLRWDRYWSDIKGGYVPQNSSVIANAGIAAGIPQSATLEVFQLADDGTPSYIGPFTVTAAQINANTATLSPAFRVRPEDVPKWNGQALRLRTLIPSAFASRIANLQSELAIADELYAKQQSNLEVQTKLIEAAGEQKDERTAELLGGGKNAGKPGLVAEIAQSDDQRNASLAEVDRLRRAISAAVAHVQRLIQENNDLARSLPGQQTPPRQTALATPPL
jgi:hypothetical protein